MAKSKLFHNKIFSRELITYLVIGSVGALVQIISNYLIIRLFNQSLENIIFIGIYLGASTAFFLNNNFTFKYKKKEKSSLIKGYLRYLILIFIPACFNLFFSILIYNYLIQNVILSQGFAIILLTTWNYLISKYFIWKYR